MRLLKIATAAMIMSIGSTTVGALELTAKCPSGITVSASVNTKVRKYPLLARFGGQIERTLIAGTLSIRNETASVAQYSNREVLLAVGNDLGIQAHLRSFASHVVDFGYIELAPKQSMQLKVYWPSNLSAGSNASAMTMNCISLRRADVPPPNKSREPSREG